mmetsp:Transcript_50021/g.100710  ORF Transcript_50021/g.100710 Transcript_50021/m.100710 type:complete len:117 (-) Transcript_50021:163-513(-)
MVARRSTKILPFALCAAVFAAWACSMMGSAFLAGKSGVAASGPPAATWGQTARPAPTAAGMTALAAEPAKKAALSDEWVDMCKEWCDLKCARPTKKAACKSQCGMRDFARPLYNRC